MNRLITIPFSHFNEKARWALDLFEVPYVERGYLPMFHMPAVALATRGHAAARSDELSTPYSTPVLITEDGLRICDSTDILQWVDEHYADAQHRLYPNQEAAELERRFSGALAKHTRALAYHWVLQTNKHLRSLARRNVGALQSSLFQVAAPVVAAMMRRVFGLTPEQVIRAKERVREEIGFADSLLADGRRYLVGEQISAADLALTCMLTPAMLPTQAEGFTAVLPGPGTTDEEAVAFAAEIRATPTGAYALRLLGERGALRPDRTR